MSSLYGFDDQKKAVEKAFHENNNFDIVKQKVQQNSLLMSSEQCHLQLLALDYWYKHMFMQTGAGKFHETVLSI